MSTNLDPLTVELLCRVQRAAVQELLVPNSGRPSPAQEALFRAKVARALFHAAASGELDPQRLKSVAIQEAAAWSSREAARLVLTHVASTGWQGRMNARG